MSLLLIKALIIKEAISHKIDPKIALAVAYVESSYNPKAKGKLGEVGLFQLMPRKPRLEAIRTLQGNIKEGLKELAYWKKNCPVKEDNTWVTCFNQGHRKPKHPKLHPYFKKVMAAYNAQRDN